MCFPSKWLKKNFSDEDKPTASGSKSTKTAEKSTANGTTVSSKERPKTLKTAIVIYTMYGHIASRKSTRPLRSFRQHD